MKNIFDYLSEAFKIMSEKDTKRAVQAAAEKYRFLRMIEKISKKTADAIKPELEAYWERYGRQSFERNGTQPVDGIQFVDVKGTEEKTVEVITLNEEMLEKLVVFWNTEHEAIITRDDVFTRTIEVKPAGKPSIRINCTDPNAAEKKEWQAQFIASSVEG